MKNLSRSLPFTFLLIAGAAAGCAGHTFEPDVDDPDDPSNPEPPADPVPLTPAGTFGLHSKFDVATNVPGTAGQVLGYFIQATDDPDDPTRFIVEKVLEALPNGSVKNTLQGAVPFVAGYLNDRLLEVAPNFVSRIVEVGNAFGQVARNFGTLEKLEIAADGAAVKTVEGVRFHVDNVDLDFMFRDINAPEVRVEGLQVTLAPSGALTISEHVVGLSYGAMLRLALDQAIIPMIDPSANNLTDLLKSVVNCQAVGQYIYAAIGVGSASTFHAACNTGLTAASGALYTRLDNIDTAALEFGLTGTARGRDKNQDGRMDDIVSGAWSGTLSYAGTPTPLQPATFYGAQM